jgi:3-oxoacyl-[acyl-carrier-protein] synthase III
MPLLSTTPAIGFSGFAAALPERRMNLEELASLGLLLSPASTLASLGFDHARVAGADCDVFRLARDAAASALSDACLLPADIDVLLWASALPENHLQPGAFPGSHLARFNSAASRLQDELGLDRAVIHGIAQQGCGGLFAALRTARALLLAEPALRHVLCVGVDALPPGCPREMLYNVVSDAAAAVVVSRDPALDRLHWIDALVVSKGYYWDVPARQKEIIASYFPTSRLVIGELLARNGLAGADIAHLVPTGVGADSWPILAQLCGIPADRLRPAAGSFGHTIAADNLLHLAALRASGGIRPGDRLLLFTYGFGSSWCGLLLGQPADPA